MADGEGHTGDIRWNFEKFLVAPGGEVVARFARWSTPEAPEVVEAIESVLPELSDRAGGSARSSSTSRRSASSPQYRLLWTGQLVTFLGSQLTVVASALQLFLLTDSSFQVGLLSLAQLPPLLVGSFVGGSLADAVDRRRLLLFAQAGARRVQRRAGGQRHARRAEGVADLPVLGARRRAVGHRRADPRRRRCRRSCRREQFVDGGGAEPDDLPGRLRRRPVASPGS